MKFYIHHTTTYRYSGAVSLQPQLVQLRPRSDGWQTLNSFTVQVDPAPIGITHVNDLGHHGALRYWFSDQLVHQLQFQVISEVTTHCTNPFNYLLEPWAVTLPIDYPTSLATQLHPYLHPQWMGYGAALDPVAHHLAQELWHTTTGNVSRFLTTLTQEIYSSCQQVIREAGSPLPPSVTWQQKQGSCRDFVVLFMDVCRAVGLASRFVSGYHQVDPGHDAYLHAWAEVYLPGAGWRGYDPTQGLAVCDRHVAVAAAPSPAQAAPIIGAFRGTGIQETLTYTLTIKNED